MRHLLTAAALILASPAAFAGPTPSFYPGPVISQYGPVAQVPDATPLPEGTEFKVAFDVGKAAEDGKVNRYIESAARFLNMHARNGVDPDNMSVVVVIHGGAANDLLDKEDNPTAGLVKALIKAGVQVELCGQTATFRNISKDDLVPGVTMSLSAMTSHALLQQDGYTLNPF